MAENEWEIMVDFGWCRKRGLPGQLTYCSCCKDRSLMMMRTGVLLIGWVSLAFFSVPEMFSFILVGTIINGNPFYVDRPCGVHECVTVNVTVMESHVPIWLAVLDLSVALTFCTLILVISIILLIGVYKKKILMVKAWFYTVSPLILMTCLYCLARLITELVIGRFHVVLDLIFGLIEIFACGLLLPWYCAAAVMSYIAMEESDFSQNAHEKVLYETGHVECTDEVRRKIPHVGYTCCCRSYSLRTEVINISWVHTAGLAYYAIWTVAVLIDAILTGHPDRKPGWSLYGSESVNTATWVDSGINWALVILWLIMSTTLLIGAYKEKLKLIQILLGMHVFSWSISLVAQVIGYMIASVLLFPRFSFVAAIKIVVIYGVYVYCIVIIKSYKFLECSIISNLESPEIESTSDKGEEAKGMKNIV